MHEVKWLGRAVCATVVCAGLVSAASAVVIETVPVGNPGNAGELSGNGAGGYGSDRICGAVDYVYRIGKYEITAGQYTEFLNVKATSDPHGLYDESMWTSTYGCKIERTGSDGSYSYSVAADRANRPVNYVSWGDAARFSNWLANGQPTGSQDLTTTEDGSAGEKGLVTAPLERALADGPDAAVFSCGPHPMLEAVTRMAGAAGAPCQVALESPMACGMGTCKGCAVLTPDGDFKYVCSDGPCFEGSAVFGGGS